MLRAKFSKSPFTWGRGGLGTFSTGLTPHLKPQCALRPSIPSLHSLGLPHLPFQPGAGKRGVPPEATADAQAGVPLGLRAIVGTGGDLHPESAQLPSIQTGLRLGASAHAPIRGAPGCTSGAAVCVPWFNLKLWPPPAFTGRTPDHIGSPHPSPHCTPLGVQRLSSGQPDSPLHSPLVPPGVLCLREPS